MCGRFGMNGDETVAELRELLLSTTAHREIIDIIDRAKSKLSGDDESARFVLAVADRYTDSLDFNCHRRLFDSLVDFFVDIYHDEHRFAE